MMTGRERHRSPDSGSNIRVVLRELRVGLRVLLCEPTARALLPIWVIFLTANASLSAVIVAFGIRQLGGSRATGFIFAALGAGFLAGAPLLKITLDRFCPRYPLFLTLAATAGGYTLLFHSSSLLTALPSAVAVGLFGSMSLAISQTTVQRVIPNAALGRVSSVFLTGEAAATLAGALAGPILAQIIHLTGLAVAASLTTALAALLTIILMPHSDRHVSRHDTAARRRTVG
jgi:predicted MFS family arabinose efflux permease